MRVAFHEAACRDLDNIRAWIAKDNPAAAERVVNRLIDSAELLGHFPRMGRAGKVPGTFEWVVGGTPYILIYTIDLAADVLTVVAVFHGARKR